MSFLFRLLPYWRWVVGLIGAAAVGGSLMYAWNASVDKEIAQRAYEQTQQQLDAVTRELEKEQARQDEARERIEQAEQEAAKIDDAKDPAADSVKHLLNELYGDR